MAESEAWTVGRLLGWTSQYLGRQGADSSRLDAEVLAIQATIPNLSHPDAPVGPDETHSRELRRGRCAPRSFDFPPLDHVALCEKLDLVDLEAGARSTGHGF